ncbi:hypothetical protein ABFT23_18790 [Nocardioides sp. C4-1]|uniref:hypothetical protein n=1 Tax=Nocardioides sp. C4-1 TaxID=3151851 RepID=UPI00326684B1
MPPRPSRAATAAVAALLALTLAAGCSSDDEPDADPSSAPAPPVDPADVGVTSTTSSIRTVTGGRLGRKEQATLQRKITAVVDEWFDHAFLGGEYPRTDFGDAYSVFTEGAQKRARDDTTLMSNEGVGTTTVQPPRADARTVEIDVLSDGGKAAAVTAVFELDMTRTGEAGARSERVFGSLYLTYGKGDGWRVFAYDVQRGDAS